MTTSGIIQHYGRPSVDIYLDLLPFMLFGNSYLVCCLDTGFSHAGFPVLSCKCRGFLCIMLFWCSRYLLYGSAIHRDSIYFHKASPSDLKLTSKREWAKILRARHMSEVIASHLWLNWQNGLSGGATTVRPDDKTAVITFAALNPTVLV